MASGALRRVGRDHAHLRFDRRRSLPEIESERRWFESMDELVEALRARAVVPAWENAGARPDPHVVVTLPELNALLERIACADASLYLHRVFDRDETTERVAAYLKRRNLGPVVTGREAGEILDNDDGREVLERLRIRA